VNCPFSRHGEIMRRKQLIACKVDEGFCLMKSGA
jgi:hypothetical protein